MTTQTIGIREVAADAGVSRQTVSRVLNDHPSVRAETRDRVVQSMERLRYVAHNGARSLRSRRSRTIGVLVDAVAREDAIALLPALEAAIGRRGLWMLVVFASADEDPGCAMRRLCEAAVDGLIVVSGGSDGDLESVGATRRTPVVRMSVGAEAGRGADAGAAEAGRAEEAVGLLAGRHDDIRDRYVPVG